MPATSSQRSILLSNRVEPSVETVPASGSSDPAIERQGLKPYSKETSENWTAVGSGRNRMMTTPGSPRSGSALSKIYSPPSQPIPATKEGIVVQALNVVTDQHASHMSSMIDKSLAKVAKKRRKQDGGVDLEHTKSGKEYIRKAQEALRLSSQGNSAEDESSSSPSSESPYLTSVGNGCTSSSGGTNEPATATTTTSQTAPSGSNPYGYEDPDQTMHAPRAQRNLRARRRNSVTEKTIRAAAQTVEGLTQLSLSRVTQQQQQQQRYGGISHATSNNTATSSGSSNPYGYDTAEPSAKDMYGYGDASESAPASGESNSNPYGYGDTSNPNPYGYGDAAPVQPTARRGRRPQRRNSVTKFSLNAASIIKKAHEERQAGERQAEAMNTDNNATESSNLSPTIQAPAMPVRKQSPWQTQGKACDSRMNIMSNGARSLNPPPVHFAPTRSASFRTTNSHDMLSSSDDEDPEDRDSTSSSSTSDDESLDESIASITIPLKSGDGPIQGMPQLGRQGSCRSFTSRGSTHSVQTYDSESESLAPDMQSLCSISQRESRTVGGTTPGQGTPMAGGLSRTPSRMQIRMPVSVPAMSLGEASNSSHNGTMSLDCKVERQRSGSLPLDTFVQGIEATSPLNSPALKPRGYAARAAASRAKPMGMGSNFMLPASTVSLPSNGRSCPTGSKQDSMLG
eukprot:Nitzschia sp. Nitz4//scaffold39_size137210//36716//38764//NITZ4_003194-RA/size137210-processed-gene-0.58-mRNA-1//-1//CDS//3329550368//2215//frame0